MLFLDKGLAQGDIDTGILTLNINGILIDVNAQYLAMTGLHKKDLLGKNIDEIDKASTKRLLAKDSSVFGHYHSTLVLNNGDICPVEVCYFFQQIDKVEQVLLFIKEINAVDIAKTSIIEQIFDHTNEAIIVTDNQGFILAVNNSFSDITGYAEKEVIGKTPAILNSGDRKSVV